jgi:hypothetical protein
MAPTDDEISAQLRPEVPHAARIWNYWMGGKDNFAADRAAGDAVAQVYPEIVLMARHSRQFLIRVVHHLATEAGLRQFLDIGTGLPSADNTHEVAQAIAPQSRVVYVDNDPLVLVHARALLTSSTDAGVTDYLDADVRDPGKILNEAARTLNFDQPVALMLVAIMHFISDADQPYDLVANLVDALPSGSYIAMSHATGDFLSAELIAAAAAREVPVYLRSRAQFERFFHGLEIVEPGIISTSEWRPEIDAELRPAVEDVAAYGAVARVP